MVAHSMVEMGQAIGSVGVLQEGGKETREDKGVQPPKDMGPKRRPVESVGGVCLIEDLWQGDPVRNVG